MLPLRDSNPTRRVPIVVIVLIILNVLAFMWELSLGPQIEQAMFAMAFIPARFWVPGHLGSDFYSIVISMFLHGGWLHLIGNMLYLWIFGDNIEDRLGHGKFILFYFLCGFAATFAHAMAAPGSRLPAIGASGAIAGVLGAYIALFPHANVLTVIPVGCYIFVREIPALLVLGLWFVMQLFVGFASIGVATSANEGGVAYFAHIGGFVAGLVLIFLLGGRRKTNTTGWS